MSKARLSTMVAQRIIEHIRDHKLAPGHHLRAQALADLFQVSRAPVNAALRTLTKSKTVYSDPNRGFFVGQRGSQPKEKAPVITGEDEVYFGIAEDRLAGRLATRVSESQLMRRYGIGKTYLLEILGKIREEGWIERRGADKWEFMSVLSSGRSYQEAYAFRASLESQALLQSGFRSNRTQLRALRRQQQKLLDGDLDRLPREELFRINTQLHETIASWSHNSFFVDSLKRVDRLRRLMEYRAALNRTRLRAQLREHIRLLDMIEKGDIAGASDFMRQHIHGSGQKKIHDASTPQAKAKAKNRAKSRG